MGIRLKFFLIMSIISMLGTAGIGYGSYRLSEKTAMAEAKKKGEIIFSYIVSTRKFFKQHQLPLVHELVEQDRFFPILMSGFSVTRGIWDKFKQGESGSDYIFKQATLDPLHPPNMADADEIKLIHKFNQNQKLEYAEGIMDKGGKKFFYLAYPIKIESKGCLRCHGDPKVAPKDQIELYGTEHGYHWNLGEVVSSFLVYVSIDESLKKSKQGALILFLSIGGAMFIVFLLLWVIMDRTVVKPIKELSERTEELSMGKGLTKPFAFHEKDEIGSLSHGIERLRNSLARLLRKAQ